MRSTGLHSGEYGGRVTKVTLSGTARASAPCHASDTVGVDGLAEFLRNPDLQRLARPGADAIDLGLRPLEDGGGQRRLLGPGQPFGAAALGAVEQPVNSVGVIAKHCVAQRLALHSRQPRRVCPARR